MGMVMSWKKVRVIGRKIGGGLRVGIAKGGKRGRVMGRGNGVGYGWEKGED